MYAGRIILLLSVLRTVTISAMATTTKFPFVDPSISAVLEITSSRRVSSSSSSSSSTWNTRKPLLDTRFLQITDEWPSSPPPPPPAPVSSSQATVKDGSSFTTTTEALRRLALECDEFVFLQQGFQNMVLNDTTSNSNALLHVLISWGDTKNSTADAQRILAALLGLNRLEAAIRQAAAVAGTKSTSNPGRAPLLTSMIATLLQHMSSSGTTKDDDKSQQQRTPEVLQALLLPTPGLNLRNLLWHGFVASLPRPWLALILVLSVILERDYYPSIIPPVSNSTITAASTSSSIDTSTPTSVQIPNLRQYPSFEPLLERGTQLLQNKDRLHSIDISWISDYDPSPRGADDGAESSHVQWWELALHWMTPAPPQQKPSENPLGTCVLITCLLEHGLRQLWCQENHQPDNTIAQPGSFYVTLDGHGQRHQHDVMLHPYVGGGDQNKKDGISSIPPTKNLLVQRLGGPAMALLADLYCSPGGGPNLRACLSHGSWDVLIQQELLGQSRCCGMSKNRDVIWDLVKILLTLMEDIGNTLSTSSTAIPPSSKPSSCLQFYRPVFSYTAVTSRNLDVAVKELTQLELPFATVSGQHQRQVAKSAANVLSSCLEEPLIDNLQVPLSNLEDLAKVLKAIMLGHPDLGGDISSSPWTSNDVFREHDVNQVLASHGAARTLLLEVADASALFQTALAEALDPPTKFAASSRQRKQRLRTIAASDLAATVYKFATLTALMLLEHDLSTVIADREEGNNPCRTDKSNTSTSVAVQVDVLERATLLQAVKRSRMTVSTVSNFISGNVDRAIKATREYGKGKAIQAVARHVSNARNDPPSN